MKVPMLDSTELKKIEAAEEKVLEATTLIKESERKIQQEEKRILSMEQEILKHIDAHPVRTLARGGLTKKEVQILHNFFVKKLSKHRLLLTIIITFGVVMVWRGFWEITSVLPFLSSPIVCLIVGFLVLWGVKTYTEL
jgi:hypothetical protein